MYATCNSSITIRTILSFLGKVLAVLQACGLVYSTDGFSVSLNIGVVFCASTFCSPWVAVWVRSPVYSVYATCSLSLSPRELS